MRIEIRGGSRPMLSTSAPDNEVPYKMSSAFRAAVSTGCVWVATFYTVCKPDHRYAFELCYGESQITAEILAMFQRNVRVSRRRWADVSGWWSVPALATWPHYCTFNLQWSSQPASVAASCLHTRLHRLKCWFETWSAGAAILNILLIAHCSLVGNTQSLQYLFIAVILVNG